MIVALLILGALAIAAAAYLVGFHRGRSDLIGRLIDSKNPEGWNWAHYLRADIKNDKTDKR